MTAYITVAVMAMMAVTIVTSITIMITNMGRCLRWLLTKKKNMCQNTNKNTKEKKEANTNN